MEFISLATKFVCFGSKLCKGPDTLQKLEQLLVLKMYGQELLDILCFKIIMGTDCRNLQETKELYNFTDAEEELLARKKRGNALFNDRF